jgi:DNA-binding PadR family transcriptional regulator
MNLHFSLLVKSLPNVSSAGQGIYIDVDIDIDMCRPRHFAAVPKGFLRWQVLELLAERPLSGAELMNQLEKLTGGIWRPSPGSVYPLLAWMCERGYVQAGGEGRYSLTQKGREQLEEFRSFSERFGERMLPPLLAFCRKLPPERMDQLRGELRRLFRALARLSSKEFSDKEFEKLLETVRKAAEGIEKLGEG